MMNFDTIAPESVRPNPHTHEEAATDWMQAVDWLPEPLKNHPIETAATCALLAGGGLAARRILPLYLTARAPASFALQEVRIVPLSLENLPGAIKAGNEGFRYGLGFLNPKADFEASLGLRAAVKESATGSPHTEMNARYWVAADRQGNVLGTTGLYETSADQGSAMWLGWMSVRPGYRGFGIGQKLLDFSVDKAREAGADKLRLYTSTTRGERAAQDLYEREGFALVGSEPHPLPIPGLRILFREKTLK